DLGIRADVPERTHLAQNLREERRIPERGRSAAEIDRHRLAIGKLARPHAQLAQHRFGVPLLRNHLLGPRGEIAIRALRQAIREMDVDAKHQSSWNWA